MTRLIAQVPKYVTRKGVLESRLWKLVDQKGTRLKYLRYLEDSVRRHPALKISDKFQGFLYFQEKGHANSVRMMLTLIPKTQSLISC